MQKYISKTDKTDIRYFDDDVNVFDWISEDTHRLMTDDEIDRHENPYKYMTDEEKAQYDRQLMPILSKIQIELCLFDIDEHANFEKALSANPRLKIQYNSTNDFFRLNQLTISIQELLGKTDHEMDEFWILASKIEE